jgi:chromatin segregation and condensation protein Rec8/ScpA/Scc1 (kleisin family)
MKQYVFTMKDDVCSQNGKTEEQKNGIFSKLAEYGTVEDFDSVLAQERAKYQQVIDNQTKQIEAIKEQELTLDEMKVVKVYRECKQTNDAQHLARINELVGQLETVKTENDRRNAQIKAILGD